MCFSALTSPMTSKQSNRKTSAAKSKKSPQRHASASKGRYTSSKKRTTRTKRHSSRSRSSESLFSKLTGQWVLTLLSSLLLLILFWHFVIAPQLEKEIESKGVYHVDIPAGFQVNGIDISHHQGDINWNQLKLTQENEETPLSFLFIKATEGGDLKDDKFDDNFAKAAETGFIRGAYHFYIPTTDPVVQADFFINNVELQVGDLPPVIDIEVKPPHNKESVFYAQLATFLYRLEAHYGVKPIIYTSFKYKKSYLDKAEFDRYPLWIAHYHVDQLKYTGPWLFWQHSDRGVIPGIPEKTDLNVFNGTMRDLRQLTIKQQ